MSPRQEPDAQRVEREITVFPAQVQAYTKNHQRPNADAGVGESVGFMEQSGINHTVSPLGAKRPTLPALGRFGRLGAEPEERSDVGAAERLSSLERRKRAVLTTSAQADTLPTEGFYD